MKKLLVFATVALVSLAGYAQQALWGSAPVVSPEVHSDHTVTFRLKAPKARQVQLHGDFLPTTAIKTERGEFDVAMPVDMVEKDGVWEWTTPQPLQPELYSYNMIIDGVKVNDPSNVYMIRDVASVFSVFIVGGERGDLYSVNEVPHGTVSRIWYESPGLKMNRRLTVYTPAGYEKGGKYPVFYLLHGAGGDEEAWINLGRTSQILDNLIAQGKVEPMIVVMTNGNAWQQAAPGESPLGYTVPSMGTGAQRQAVEADFVSTFPDVVKFVEKTYRVKKGKANRAIAGLSMGASHSCAISRLYPDMFDYVGLFSGGGGRPNLKDNPLYGDMEGLLAKQFAKKPALYYIACGNRDFVYKGIEEYRQFLTEKGYPFEYFETGEGHIWRNWRIYLSEFAPRLFKK